MHEVDLGDLGIDEGAHLLLKRALRHAPVGEPFEVSGTAPNLSVHLAVWCRAHGHTVVSEAADNGRVRLTIAGGPAEAQRWASPDGVPSAAPKSAEAIADRAPRAWGLAARGATVEAGAPEFGFTLVDKLEVWSDEAARIYAQAAAAQWDPRTAIPWDAHVELPEEIEDAVVQLMTYLIENETAALIVPSRFIAQLHPHFREVMQVLAIQAADEARHIEIFTRRALLKRSSLGVSTTGGQASLKTLVEEPDFATASFLLSVLGEGTFLTLLWFIEHYAPDPVTAAVAKLAAQDEARHVAFGMAHIRDHMAREPTLASRLAAAVERRHDALRYTTGLNAEVFDALALLAAGSWDIPNLRAGYAAVTKLTADMDAARSRRLVRVGFSELQASELSSLHTRNFM